LLTSGLTIYLLSSIALPALLGWWTGARLNVSWRFFGYGALTWIGAVAAQTLFLFPFLLFIRIRHPLLYAHLRPAFQIANALCSGVFEELARYIGYQLLFNQDKKTWGQATMYGLGSACAESTILAMRVSIPILTRSVSIKTLPIQLILAAFRRVCSLALQVSLSILVLQAFLRASRIWLVYAISLHSLVDVTTELPTIVARPKWNEPLVTAWTESAGAKIPH
jgi:uncharacterized membrane protein YhfC